MRTTFGMTALAVCVLTSSGIAAAHNHGHDHDEEVRHASAHVHGEGELNFAIEGSELHLELMMPAHDILGFESINTEAQQQQLDAALKTLESEQIWQLPASAQCVLSHANASATGHDDHHDHGHDDHHDHKDHDHGHDDHGHKKHDDHKAHDDHEHEHGHNHGHDHGHDHGHGHGHGHHDHGAHMDIAVSYEFKCSNPTSLNQFSTTLFETFPRSEKIHVQGFTQQGQLSDIITAQEPEVRF